jgi:hypothetical protein
MIIFPSPMGASIVYREDTLTDEQKAKGIRVDSLPVPEHREGKVPVLNGNLETGQVFYEYKDKPEEVKDPVEVRLERLENLLVEKEVLTAQEIKLIEGEKDGI